MTADVNVTEKVTREIVLAIYPHINYLTGDAWAASKRATEAALSALSGPEALAGIAGVLREHGDSRQSTGGFLLVCRCGDAVDDMAEHQATALADWLRGQGAAPSAGTAPTDHSERQGEEQ